MKIAELNFNLEFTLFINFVNVNLVDINKEVKEVSVLSKRSTASNMI